MSKMKIICFFLQFFFKLLPKLSDLINSDDCIDKIRSKSIRLHPVFIKKTFELKKKGLFRVKK